MKIVEDLAVHWSIFVRENGSNVSSVSVLVFGGVFTEDCVKVGRIDGPKVGHIHSLRRKKKLTHDQKQFFAKIDEFL